MPKKSTTEKELETTTTVTIPNSYPFSFFSSPFPFHSLLS